MSAPSRHLGEIDWPMLVHLLIARRFRFARALARHLGLTSRPVSRWLDGIYAPSGDLPLRLIEIADEVLDEKDRQLARLPAAAEGES